MSSPRVTQASTVVAVLLILGGIVSFFYGSAMYTREYFDAMQVVPVDVTLGERGGSLPIWGGVASVGLAIVLLVAPRHTQLRMWATGLH